MPARRNSHHDNMVGCVDSVDIPRLRIRQRRMGIHLVVDLPLMFVKGLMQLMKVSFALVAVDAAAIDPRQ